MKSLFAISLVLMMSISLYGQEAASPDPSSSLTLLQAVIPRDPAALGMGGTSALEVVSMAGSAFSNPGVIPFCDAQTDFTVSYQKWQPELPSSSDNVGVGFAYNHSHKLGVSVAFASDMLSAYDVADGNGVIRSGYNPSNMVAAVGFSYRFIPDLAFSATARYLYSNIYDDVGYGSPSFDAGLTYGNGALMAAAGVRNAGADVDGKYPLPTSVYASGSYVFVTGASSMAEIRAEFDMYLYGAVRVAAGGSWTYRAFTARLGYNLGGGSPLGDFLSFGFGAAAGFFHADAALLLSDGPMNGTFCVGIGFSL